VNRTALNMAMQVYFFILVYSFSDICLRVVWQDHKVGLLLIFWGTAMLIYIVVAPVYTPTKDV
jgi:hypothetical protein